MFSKHKQAPIKAITYTNNTHLLDPLFLSPFEPPQPHSPLYLNLSDAYTVQATTAGMQNHIVYLELQLQQMLRNFRNFFPVLPQS